MLYSLTIALSENMAKNKDFILLFHKLDLYEKWDKTILITYLISASCGKSFGDRTSLPFCLFKEPAWADMLVSGFEIDLSNYLALQIMQTAFFGLDGSLF